MVAQLIKNLPEMQETPVQFRGQEDPLEKGWAIHFRILRLPWWLRQLRVCLQSGRPRFNPWVGKIPLEKETATHSSILAWRIAWTEVSARLQSIGSQRVRHD